MIVGLGGINHQNTGGKTQPTQEKNTTEYLIQNLKVCLDWTTTLKTRDTQDKKRNTMSYLTGSMAQDNPELQAELVGKFQELLGWAGDRDNPEWRCLTQEAFDQVKGLNYGMLAQVFAPYSDYYDAMLKDREQAKARGNAWKDTLSQQEVVEGAVTKICCLINSKSEPKCAPKNRKIGGAEHKGVWIPEKYAGLVFELLTEKKGQVLAEWDKANAPEPPKAKSSGTRLKKGEFDGEVVEVISKAKALESESDFKYYFEGDEGQTFVKGTLNKDKTKKTMKHKCVGAKRYLGGAESQPDDGYCVGAVKWELAGGSVAIADTGMSTSQFRIRCGSKVDGGGKCDKCVRGQNPDFFTDTYKITKGDATKFDGVTYKCFITDNLVSAQR